MRPMILGEMTEEELLDYRGEMADLAAPYLERIRAIDVALAKLAAPDSQPAKDTK